MLRYHQVRPRRACAQPLLLLLPATSPLQYRSASWVAACTFPAFDDAQKGERRTKPLMGAQRGSRAGDRERQPRPLMLTKKGDMRTKPLRPPVRPLRRLIIGAQHTIKYLETHPTAWLWWADLRPRQCVREDGNRLQVGAFSGDDGWQTGAPAFVAHQKGERRTKSP